MNWLFGGRRPQSRTHDYTCYSPIEDYIFEATDNGQSAYLTSTCRLPKSGDVLLLPDGTGTVCYRVVEIEEYLDTTHAWTALLEKIVD
ncbi:MAG: hypothetical protein J7641_05410 [Cyanobacteria bacterium SID2]|nr:hypothetical protein [Cyanobacteria bacterium SID2]MBP0004806.1 hypothetical protein [Cyanobacteria bacterium SBC]